MYIVKLQRGVWINNIKLTGSGRTVREKYAQEFKNHREAQVALDYALKRMQFKNPQIITVI